MWQQQALPSILLVDFVHLVDSSLDIDQHVQEPEEVLQLMTCTYPSMSTCMPLHLLQHQQGLRVHIRYAESMIGEVGLGEVFYCCP